METQQVEMEAQEPKDSSPPTEQRILSEEVGRVCFLPFPSPQSSEVREKTQAVSYPVCTGFSFLERVSHGFLCHFKPHRALVLAQWFIHLIACINEIDSK